MNYNTETSVILSTNTGNCTVPNTFNAAGGGVTLGTAATYTPSSTYYSYMMTLLGTSEVINMTTSLVFAG